MPSAGLNLADWRRAIADLYAEVRSIAAQDPERAWRHFREQRDRLVRDHPSSPLTAELPQPFAGLPYYPYDPNWRMTGLVIEPADGETRDIELPEGMLRLTRIGKVSVPIGHHEAQLGLFWIAGYGGGLFLPFKDHTNGRTTYGGGRYLLDTIKGADLGGDADSLVLDFNFAYHPSCAYSRDWVCPLAPPENTLPLEVEAGERLS
ncbi:MAG: DUF1684 domain-containing protein [Candidatus Bipolaricaulia bacterium]